VIIDNNCQKIRSTGHVRQPKVTDFWFIYMHRPITGITGFPHAIISQLHQLLAMGHITLQMRYGHPVE
jgi:hypothetical protein